MTGKTGAIFLDRDGVINENRLDHVKCWDEFQFNSGALESIRELTLIGLPIFVVTNQAIISRRQATLETLTDIHVRMQAAISASGGHITRVYYCPHDSHENCSCRKPAPGMLLQAAQDFNIDLSRSFLVGDACTDIAAAIKAGAQGILLLTGRGPNQFADCWKHFGEDFWAAADLRAATALIKDALDGKSIASVERMRRAFDKDGIPANA
jgi:D-glycero-D-manno-heptose 1,7-bisphosphate phosphatase